MFSENSVIFCESEAVPVRPVSYRGIFKEPPRHRQGTTAASSRNYRGIFKEPPRQMSNSKYDSLANITSPNHAHPVRRTWALKRLKNAVRSTTSNIQNIRVCLLRGLASILARPDLDAATTVFNAFKGMIHADSWTRRRRVAETKPIVGHRNTYGPTSANRVSTSVSVGGRGMRLLLLLQRFRQPSSCINLRSLLTESGLLPGILLRSVRVAPLARIVL